MFARYEDNGCFDRFGHDGYVRFESFVTNQLCRLDFMRAEVVSSRDGSNIEVLLEGSNENDWRKYSFNPKNGDICVDLGPGNVKVS